MDLYCAFIVVRIAQAAKAASHPYHPQSQARENHTMKKLNAAALTGVALALAGISNASHAQSSVTLYGILDAGITYVNNTGGSHVVKFDDGISYGNRLGFKGVEDLGGGLKAVFVLESGFHLGNGTLGFGGSEFGR